MTSPRQKRLVELARRAWPDQSVEVVAPEDHSVHVWDERGRVLLHCDHPFADAVLALLAGDAAASSVGVCIDIADFVIRDRARKHGIDVIGWREGQIVLWDDEGKMGDGLSLRTALNNLDGRQRDEHTSERLLVGSTGLYAVAGTKDKP